MPEIIDAGSKAGREARAKQQEIEGRKAREDYAAEVEARDANMARLKALRLERDQAVRDTPPAAPVRRRAVRKPAVKAG